MPNLQDDFLQLLKNSLSDLFKGITEKWAESIPIEKQEKFIKDVHKQIKKFLKDLIETSELYSSIKIYKKKK